MKLPAIFSDGMVLEGDLPVVVWGWAEAGERIGVSLAGHTVTAGTGARKEEMLAWMRKVSCPVLVLQGKSEGLYKANFEVLIPEMKKLGANLSVQTYPGVTHGFYFGARRSGATPELVDTLVNRVIEFIESAAKPPVPVALSATHVAMSVIRMEPVWMTLGQVAGCAAHEAIGQGVAPVDVDPDTLIRQGCRNCGRWKRGRLEGRKK